MSKKTIYFLLVAIVLLGFLLRLYALTGESLWTDEMVSLSHARQETISSLAHSVAEKELMPAGYFIFLSYWIKLFGESEFSLRFPSLLFDLGSIILIFLLGAKSGAQLFGTELPGEKKVTGDVMGYLGRTGLLTGLLSSLFLSTTMLQVLYAQEARPYSFFTFLALLSSLLLVHFYKKQNLSSFLVYTLVTALALHINYMAFFLIFFQLLAIIFYSNHFNHSNQSNHFNHFNQGGQKRFLNIYFLSLVSLLILFIPQINILIRQVQLRQPFLQQFFHYLGLPSFLAQLGLFFYLLPVVSLSLLIVLGMLFFKKKRESLILYFSNKNIFLITLFLLLIAGAMHLLFLEKSLRSFTLIRHSFFVAPFFYLFAARSIVAYSITAHRRIVIDKLKLSVPLLVILGILIFNAFTLTAYYQTVSKPPWREAVPFIEENFPENPLLLFERGGSNIKLYEYYSSGEARMIDLSKDGGDDINGVNNLDNLDELVRTLSREKSFWLVSSRIMVKGEDYKALFDREFELRLKKEYPELSVYLYQT